MVFVTSTGARAYSYPLMNYSRHWNLVSGCQREIFVVNLCSFLSLLCSAIMLSYFLVITLILEYHYSRTSLLFLNLEVFYLNSSPFSLGSSSSNSARSFSNLFILASIASNSTIKFAQIRCTSSPNVCVLILCSHDVFNYSITEALIK